jgi:pyruvate formate lyase activating enzyme
MDENNVHQVRRDISCNGCKKCVAVCPMNALNITGELKTTSELLDIVREDESFYDMSGGGVTLSGGECTAQPEAALALLRACKEEGINTAIESCGHADTKRYLEIAKYVDLFLFDLKHMDPVRHNELTGISNELILKNLKEVINSGHKVLIRMPMLKGINSSEAEIKAIIDFLLPYKDMENFQGINLLPYHKLGVNKYGQLGMDYQIEGDPSLDEAEMDQIETWIKKYDFPVKVIRH